MSEGMLGVEMAREALQGGLATVARAIPAKASLPVLANVLFETTDRGMRLTAFNGQMAIRTQVPADVGLVGTGGRVALNGKRMGEIARELPPGIIKLEGAGQSVQLKSGRSKFKLVASQEEYPDLPPVQFGAGVTVTARPLAEAIARVAFAVSTEEARKILQAVNLEFRGEDLRLVATNGHRLAMYDIPGARPGGVGTKSFLVPPAALETLRRLVEKLDATAQVEIAEDQHGRYLGLRGAGTDVLTGLIEGPYPKYEAVIPPRGGTEATPASVAVVDREPFHALIRRMGTVASEQRRRIALTFKSGVVVGDVQEPDVGDATDECPLASFTGNEVRIGFNVDYLTEVMRNVPGDTLSIEMTLPERAVVFRPFPDDTLEGGARYLCLIMPLRLD